MQSKSFDVFIYSLFIFRNEINLKPAKYFAYLYNNICLNIDDN